VLVVSAGHDFVRMWHSPLMDPDQLVKLAIQLADRHYGECVAKIIEVTKGDHTVITEANRMLAGMNVGAGRKEHIAFTYLSAAFQEIAREKYPRAKGPTGEVA
jgi:hypothetical protein